MLHVVSLAGAAPRSRAPRAEDGAGSPRNLAKAAGRLVKGKKSGAGPSARRMGRSLSSKSLLGVGSTAWRRLDCALQGISALYCTLLSLQVNFYQAV